MIHGIPASKPIIGLVRRGQHTPLIAEKAQRAESFMAAMADGASMPSEIAAQEIALVALMAEDRAAIEPGLARQGDGVAVRTDGIRLHAGDAVD